MSERLSTLEEHQCKMRTSIGFETRKLVVYPPLPPPAVEEPWAWYRNAKEDDNNNEIEEEPE
jgi:hypothetical protein